MRRIMRSGEDGMLFALLLNNVNNNPANVPPHNRKDPSTDSLQILPSSVLLEYEPRREMSLPGGQKHQANRPRGHILRAVGYETQQEQATSTHRTAEAHSERGIDGVLSAEQLQSWKRNGYLVIEEALRPHELVNLRTSLTEIVERLSNVKDEARKEHLIPRTPLGNDGASIVNPNGRLIASMLEGPSDNNLDPIQLIQRIGTDVHRILPAFRSITFSQKNNEIASLLGFEDPRVTQSIVITKPRGVGAEVIPHQDGCSNFTNPPSSVTFWYALQDTSVANGCLKVVSGSHRTEPLTMRSRRGKNGYLEFVDLPGPVYAKEKALGSKVTATSGSPEQPGTIHDYVYEPLEVKAGTLILLHSTLVHASEANRSDTNRLAYNFAVVEGKLPWPEDAYLQPYEGHSEFEKLEPKCGEVSLL